MKKILALLLLTILLLSLLSCNKSSNGQSTDALDASDKKPEKATEPPVDNELINSSNMLMAHDQLGERLVIYDLDAYEDGKTLDDLETFDIKVGHAAGLKYRENTVLGNVILVAGTRTEIYSYPTGKRLWYTKTPGANPHSIEMLPSGNIVVASSSDGILRFFRTSALVDKNRDVAKTYSDYNLEDAHGVLWDPEYEVLWALGAYDLKAYKVEGEGSREKLVPDPQMSIKLPEGKYWGHDLSPDYTDTRYLYITVGSCVMRFDKEERSLSEEFPNSNLLNRSNVKGFSNNPNGNLFATGETGGEGCEWKDWEKAAWCTNTIYYYRANGEALETIKLTTEKSAFYKARAFCGRYQ
ncbi:MAG: WD40 repeat domain-containing protein [Clostridia bacterium]|nr:WD40 repeat domain-containing protein [Clostridia bacterium]